MDFLFFFFIRIPLWFGLLVYSQEIISSARPPTSDSRSPDPQHASLSIPSCHVSSLRGTDGHCDCLGWFQQHLPMGANEQVPPEVDTVTRHRAQKHAGTNDQAGPSDRDEALNEMRQDLVLVWLPPLVLVPGQRHTVRSRAQVHVHAEPVQDERGSGWRSVQNHPDIRLLYQHLPGHPVCQVSATSRRHLKK